MEYCLNILSGNSQEESILGLNSLIDVGYRFKEVLGKDEKFSSARLFKVTSTEHNNPVPTLRNKGLSFHTCVLSRCYVGDMGRIMENLWSRKGRSTHAFFFKNGEILLWKDPTVHEVQIPVPYNAFSLVALVETESHLVSEKQIISINEWIIHCCKIDGTINVKNLLCHSEAFGSGRNGEIDNIDEIRRATGLGSSTTLS